MRRSFLCLATLLVSVGMATDASACRIARPGIVLSVAEQDARDLAQVDVAVIGIVTAVTSDPVAPSAEFSTRDTLRGNAPPMFAYGGGELVIVTCYPQPPYEAVIQGVQRGDEVLIFAANIDAQRPFDVMKLDDPRAMRLLALLRSERNSAQ